MNQWIVRTLAAALPDPYEVLGDDEYADFVSQVEFSLQGSDAVHRAERITRHFQAVAELAGAFTVTVQVAQVT
jgi:hypothetical protein